MVKVVAAPVVGQRTYRDARGPIYYVSVADVGQRGHVDWPGSSSANETSIPKPSARNIIPKYPKDSNIVNQEGGKTLAEFPNSIELGKLGPGQDPNNKEHSTTSLV